MHVYPMIPCHRKNYGPKIGTVLTFCEQNRWTFRMNLHWETTYSLSMNGVETLNDHQSVHSA